MKNYTFNQEQLDSYVSLISNFTEYQGSQDFYPVYETFLQSVFGNDWHELVGEWDVLFEYEFDTDPYYFMVTDIQTDPLKDWIEEGKERLSEILQELLEDDFVV
jgi:hypothetical protein